MRTKVRRICKEKWKAGINVDKAALFSIRSSVGGLKFVETIDLLDLSGTTVVSAADSAPLNIYILCNRIVIMAADCTKCSIGKLLLSVA